MTVRASGAAQPGAPASPTSTAPTAELRTPSGVVLGGSLNGDVIIASTEALAIVKAGLLVRAFVIAGMELMKRTVTAGGGRTIRLEFGFYQVVS